MDLAPGRTARFVTRVITATNEQKMTVIKPDHHGIRRKISFSYTLTPEAELAVANLHS